MQMSLWQRLADRFTSDKTVLASGEAESLRLEFQSRYLQFKLLLNANNQALAIMALSPSSREYSPVFVSANFEKLANCSVKGCGSLNIVVLEFFQSVIGLFKGDNFVTVHRNNG